MSDSSEDGEKAKTKSFWQSVFQSGHQPGLRGIRNRVIDYLYGTVYSWIRRYQDRH